MAGSALNEIRRPIVSMEPRLANVIAPIADRRDSVGSHDLLGADLHARQGLTSNLRARTRAPRCQD
jgi:hypothetical protein